MDCFPAFKINIKLQKCCTMHMDDRAKEMDRKCPYLRYGPFKANRVMLWCTSTLYLT